ncbi:hypothetical protein GCM10010430_78280 [Kitasatospora cystarginea]|uniref:Uncharacterized protein n=2 Tax=Kitasatospora TaxID=2063 RepID=A0ABN3F1H5_9ACTN
MGVEGKRSLWNALLQISDLVEGLDRRQLERLAARATNQSELLDTVRNEAARRSLTKPEPPDTRTPRRPHRV